MKRILWLLVLVGLVAALFLLHRRHELEAANRTTEPVLDYQAVLDLARASGEPGYGEALFERYQSYGIHSLAVPEWTLDDLELEGVLRVFNGLQLRALDRALGARPGHVYLVFDEQKELAAIERNMRLALGKDRVQELTPNILDVAIDLPTLRTMGLGFLPDRLNALADKGWRLWLRPENKPVAALAILDNAVQELKPGSVAGFIFGGLPNEAVGYPKELKEASDWIDAHDLEVGYVELDPQVQQKGINTMARTHPNRVVRVMAVVPLQQARLAPDTVVSMYSLGARERTLRVLYLRPYTTPWRETGDLAATNEALLKGLVTDLQTHDSWADFLKGQLGNASTYPVGSTHPSATTRALVGLVAMGVMAAVCLLLLEIFPAAPPLVLYGLIGLVAGGAAGWSLANLPSFARALLALTSSLTLPVLGLVANLPYLEEVGRRTRFLSVFLGSLWLTVRVTAVSLAGALMSASVLYDTTFLLGLDLFRGVKLLSLVAPLVVLAFYLARQGGREELLKVLNLDLKLWHVLGLGVLGVVGLFYIMRTGNVGAPGGDAMDTERYVRRYLDALLGVRPRFKEFVLGHPALMLAPFLIRLHWRRLVWLALLAAAIGQASLVDTFAHTHTPVVASLLRTLIGLGVGWGVGTGAVLLLVGLASLMRRFLPAPMIAILGSNGNGMAQSASNPLVQAGAPPIA